MVCQKESGDEGNAPLKPKSGKPVSVKALKSGKLRSAGGGNKNGRFEEDSREEGRQEKQRVDGGA